MMLPEPVLGIDTVVAGIDIAVVLDDERAAALLRMDADRRRVADPGIEGPLEVHDKDLAHIVTDPFLVDGNEKVAVLLGNDRPGSDFALLVLLVQRRRTSKTQAHAAALRASGMRSTIGVNWMNSTPCIPEEAVYLERPVRRFSGHTGQHVVFDLVLLQKFQAAHGLRQRCRCPCGPGDSGRESPSARQG